MHIRDKRHYVIQFTDLKEARQQEIIEDFISGLAQEYETELMELVGVDPAEPDRLDPERVLEVLEPLIEREASNTWVEWELDLEVVL